MKNSFFTRFTIFSALIIVFLSTDISYAVQTSIDISKHWAKDAITSANAEGWAYIENGKYNPNKAATREEVVWMLVGACKTVPVEGFDINKKADITKFKDKPSSWAQDRMAVAVGNAFVSGYSDGTLKPKANITRAELAVILGRLSKTSESSNFLPFWDSIPLWAVNEVEKTYALKIVTGYADGSFKPNANVTKAEALVMIERWKKLHPAKPQLCEEFKKISNALKGIEMIDDNLMLLYYGPNGKTTSVQEEKFYISRFKDGNFAVILSDFEDETYKDLQTALNTILPTSAGKLINEVKNMSNVNEKQITLDNKKIDIYVFPSYTTISIRK